MKRIVKCAVALWLACAVSVSAQHTAFDSFVSRIATQYKVDIALSPDLIPTIDSILESGTAIESIDALLHVLVSEEHLTYQIIDGNKLMLRRDDTPDVGQNLLAIEGTIADHQSGQPLPYAIVRTADGSRGVQTNEQGRFRLMVADTTGMIEIDYLGYAPIQKKISEFMHGAVTVNMRLREIPLEEVTIVIPYKEMYNDAVTQSLNLNQYELISEDQLLQWNVERLINTLTAYTQFSSDEGIRIRGVDSGNSLFVMDGMPVYDPYHFYNIFSPFNPNYFSTVRLYKNNLPVAYGGRIDGMIQLESSGTKSKDHLILDSDLLLSTIDTRIGIGNHLSFSGGARISHNGIINQALKDTTMIQGGFKNNDEYTTIQEPRFHFYDINAGLQADISPASKLQFNFFKSRDQLDIRTTKALTTRFFNEVITVEQLFNSQDEWKNLCFSTALEQKISNKIDLLVSAYYSNYQQIEQYTSLYNEERYFMHSDMENSGFQQSRLKSQGLKADVKIDLPGKSYYEMGLDLNRYAINLNAYENHNAYVDQQQREQETSLFGEYQKAFSNRLMIVAGTRLTHLEDPSSWFILPNLRVSYFPEKHLNVRASFSKNVQAVHEITIENRFQREVETLILNAAESGYPVLTSDKYMVGAGFTSTHFSIDAELYYKKLDGLLRISTLQPDPGNHNHSSPDNYYKLFGGDGWTRGLDLTVFYKQGKTDLVASYTLSKITEHYDELFNGKDYAPEEDRRHQLKLSGKQEVGRFDFSALLTYKSKAPYISLIRLEDPEDHHGHHGNIGMAEYDEVVDYLPYFLSLDFSADYSFDLLNQKAQIGVSLINATDRSNIQEKQHTGSISRADMGSLFLTQQTELLGRTWNAHFRIAF